MAEFALGLTKTAVEGTLSRVKSVIEEEGKQRQRVQEDLVFITGEFQMMQAFLNASSVKGHASKNLVAQAWVRQLRDLAFDVEDCVEFVVHLDEPSRWDWVQRLASSLPCLGRPQLPLDLAVAEIKRLKARVEDVSQRNTRYNLMAGSGDYDDENQHQQLIMSPAGGHTSARGAEAFHVLRDVWKAMGKLPDTTGDLKMLIDCQGSELKVISLWASPQADVDGELEWASIAKKAYVDPEICQQFKNRAWVKLINHFNPVDFLNNLLTRFTPDNHDRHDDMPKLMLQVSQHKYLIILEQELSSVADWEAIKMYLRDGNNGSRIIVSTKHLEIARVCTGEPFQVWELKCLSHDRYLWAIFPDLQASDQKGQKGHADGVGNIMKEEGGSEPAMLVGRDREYALLYNFCSLASVWGIAGVGKTAVVRKIYNDDKILSGSHKIHGWVDVPHPFSLTVLCQRLLMDLHRDDLSAKETEAIAMMEGQDPIQRCCEILHEKNFLLVIDGLQSNHGWDLIKEALLSDANIHGKTIVITREERIATHCAGENILNIKGLEDNLALELFKKITLDGYQLSEISPGIEKILRQIMSKCGGLPEVIVAIRKMVCPYSVKIKYLEIINSDFMGKLESLTDFPCLSGLFCWMQTYFDDCPDELKPCIFYMTIFPAEQILRRSRLLRRWIAEGYSSSGGGTTEEKAEELLSKLMKLSILYQEQHTSSRSCKVNGFFHEYIQSRQLKDNHVFVLEGSCSPSSRLTGQHLTISSSWDRDMHVFNSIDLSRLRSLTVFGKWVPLLISDKMKVLRVLDLEGTSSTPESDGASTVKDDDLEMIVKKFPRLKFISLRGCKHITRLPGSMGSLSQLETLDAWHTSIVELPPAIITKLHKLQYIFAGTTEATRLPLPAAVVAQTTRTPAGTSTSSPLPTAAAETTPTPSPPLTTTTEEDVHCGMSPLLGAKEAALCVVQRASTRITGEWKRRAHALVESSSSNSWWESKKQRRRRVRVAANGGGVEVVRAAAEGIGKLAELHTLGVVNIAGGRGVLLLFLRELKKLTQLRKLGLSGINSKNWCTLCNAISGHLPHLESLSLQLLLLEEDGSSYNFALFDDISAPPKTLKSLKVLYTTNAGAGAGWASIRPAWLKQLGDLEGFQHGVTISSQEDIYIFVDEMPLGVDKNGPLRIKPVGEHLNFKRRGDVGPPTSRSIESLRIDCSCNKLPCSKVTFGKLLGFSVKALSIHCCCKGSSSASAGTSSAGSSSPCNLQVAGLNCLWELEEVKVTGLCSDELKRDLLRQIDELGIKTNLR